MDRKQDDHGEQPRRNADYSEECRRTSCSRECGTEAECAEPGQPVLDLNRVVASSPDVLDKTHMVIGLKEARCRLEDHRCCMDNCNQQQQGGDSQTPEPPAIGRDSIDGHDCTCADQAQRRPAQWSECTSKTEAINVGDLDGRQRDQPGDETRTEEH